MSFKAHCKRNAVTKIAVNKSAASAASPGGFSSRDQVGCEHSLPADQKPTKKSWKYV